MALGAAGVDVRPSVLGRVLLEPWVLLVLALAFSAWSCRAGLGKVSVAEIRANPLATALAAVLLQILGFLAFFFPLTGLIR
jgi:hypothetical protein